jgi:hypothetical protein
MPILRNPKSKVNYGSNTGFVPPKLIERESPNYKVIPKPTDPRRKIIYA